MDSNSLATSQKKLKLFLGGLAIGLPSALVIGDYWLSGATEELSSLSTYYHSDVRDIFVGVLFTIGMFLLTYEGYNHLDRFLSMIAGGLVLVVALVPTTKPGEPTELPGTIHLIAAGSFLFILAIFSLFRFTKSDPEIPPTIRKHIRNIIYRICGFAIIGSLFVVILLVTTSLSLPINNPIFWLEYLAISAFGTAWIVKGEGIFFLNDDPILKMRPWELTGFIVVVILALGSVYMLSLLLIL